MKRKQSCHTHVSGESYTDTENKLDDKVLSQAEAEISVNSEQVQIKVTIPAQQAKSLFRLSKPVLTHFAIAAFTAMGIKFGLFPSHAFAPVQSGEPTLICKAPR
jgi:hypothetical protein